MSWRTFDVPQDLREMLDKNEKILWAAKPKKAPFVLKSIAALIVIIPFLVMPIIVFWIAGPAIIHPFVIMFFLFWYGILSLIALTPLYNFLMWKNIWYALTNKRIIVRTGLIGIDYDVLELENIQQVNVNVGLVDKIFGTGTITLQSIGVKPLTLWAVEEPYKAQKMIRHAIEEAKSNRSPL